MASSAVPAPVPASATPVSTPTASPSAGTDETKGRDEPATSPGLVAATSSGEEATPAPTPDASSATTPAAAAPTPDPGGATPTPAEPASVAVPRFTSAAANDYVQAYEAYLVEFRAAYEKMMKQADLSDYAKVINKASELQLRGEQVEAGLEPEDREKLGKYLDAKAEELGRITNERL